VKLARLDARQKQARTVGEMNPNFLLKYRGSRTQSVLIAAATVALLAGCSTYDSLTQRVVQRITPYRITVVQGNFVSQEAAAKMRVGMTRAEVKSVLGTPLLADMFHADRWDYLFYFKRGSTAVVQQRDFIVDFKDDRVVSWSGGNDLPSELELLADIDGDKRGKKAKAAAVAAAASAATPASASASAAADAAAAAAASAPAALAIDPNEQAAQAANRAVNQVQSTKPGTPSSARVSAPTAAGMTPGAAPLPGAPQLQIHRKPRNAPDNNMPVGPAGSDSDGTDGASLHDQPLTPSQSAKGSGG
jgi:outer membrane protein assembly factor BamE